MTWLLWQQQRRLVTAVAIGFVAVAVFLTVTGLHLASTYHDSLRTCASSLAGCANLPNTVFLGDNRLFDMVDAVGFSLPFVLGLFWGGPLVAKEIEEGTHRLAWSQTITRRHWMVAKLGWTLLAAVVLTGAFSAIVTWWYGPVNAVLQNRLGSVVFDTQGLVPVGYAVFGVALGTLLGLLLRRVLPAMAATLAAFGLVRYAFDQYVRPHLLPAKTALVSITTAFVNYPAGAGSWLLGNPKYLNAAGKVLSGPKINPSQLPQACRQVWYSDIKLSRCLANHGFRALLSYQPAGRYWPLQGIEVAIYVTAAFACAAFASWWVIQRDV
jgi:hypothetical protein